MGALRAHIPGDGRCGGYCEAVSASPGSRQRDPTCPLPGEVKGDAATSLIQPYRNLTLGQPLLARGGPIRAG